MHATVRRAIHTALLTGGLVVAGSVAAHAAEDDGLLAGLGIQAPVDVSVDVSGLAAGLLGDATVTGAGGAPADPAPAPTASVAGGSAEGAVSGTEVAAPVHVPVDVSAVALGVLGDAAVSGDGTAAPAAPAPAAPAAVVSPGDSQGVASGTAVAAPVSVPVTVDSVALGVLGDAAVAGPGGGDAPAGDGPEATVAGGDADGVASGTAVATPVSVPVTVGDVAIGLLGDSTVSGTPGTTNAGPGAGAPTAEVGSGDADGLAAGTGVAAPISVPVTIGDVSLGLLGDSAVTDTTGTTGATGTPTAEVGSGDADGLAAGTGVASPISVPVTVGALALGLLGDAAVTGQAAGTDADADVPGATTGEGAADGPLAGLGLALPLALPVTIGDVALGVAGDATAAAPGTGGTTIPGTTGPGTTTPGTTTPGSTTPGSTTPGSTTPGTPGGPAAPVSAVLSAVLAAADRAATLDATATAGSRTMPAALAPTGAPAAVLSLTAAGLVALGLLLRRLPRTAL